MFGQPRFSYAIMALLLVLPQTLYVIGDYIATGIRFPFFRYQDSIYGTSLIPINREVVYITSGLVGPRTALATWVWIAGLFVLIAAAVLVISWHRFDNQDHARYVGPLLFATGILFLAWGMVQYGPLLHSSTGYAIPIGVPVLWYCGWQFMRAVKADATGEE